MTQQTQASTEGLEASRELLVFILPWKAKKLGWDGCSNSGVDALISKTSKTGNQAKQQLHHPCTPHQRLDIWGPLGEGLPHLVNPSQKFSPRLAQRTVFYLIPDPVKLTVRIDPGVHQPSSLPEPALSFLSKTFLTFYSFPNNLFLSMLF